MARARGSSSQPGDPPSITPEAAVPLLRRQHERGDSILASRPIPLDIYDGWHSTTLSHLVRAFGSKDNNVSAFETIGRLLFVGPETEQEAELDRSKYLSRKLVLLVSCIEQLEDLLEIDPGRKAVPKDARRAPSKVNVFIGHGHNSQWRELLNFLRRDERYNVIAYETGVRAGYATSEVLQELVEKADIAFIVHTGEDETSTGEFRARENVVHEAGLFQGKLGFKRAIVLLEEGCEEYSNIFGISQLRFSKGMINTTFGDVVQTIHREFPAVPSR